ncbi:MAG: hypothetical protein Q9162_004404 [Coniocarpon cinnabarinum]
MELHLCVLGLLFWCLSHWTVATYWPPAPIPKEAPLLSRDVDPETLYPTRNATLKVDNFQNSSMYEPHSNETFQNRYWFDDTKATTFRLPILQKGIIYQLDKQYNGLGVVIEHRYFGRSQPTPDLSVENLRFLTTEQALEDVVNFAKNNVFPGHENDPLTSDKTPWIAYGGSYSGAFTAFMRTLYPGDFWGTISSSGVTEAIYDYWEYYSPVTQYGPQPCIEYQQKLVNMVDNILLDNGTVQELDYCTVDNPMVPQLKGLFGLEGLTCANDFAAQVSWLLGAWQSLNWDPEVNSTQFGEYCSNVSASTLQFDNSDRTESAQQLLTAGGYGDQLDELTTPLLNMAGFINQSQSVDCTSGGQTLDQCWGTHNLTYYQQDDLDQSSWRSWPYMYCTQWGYLQTGSGVPADQLPVISRTVNLNYTSIICRDAFGIDTPPDTDKINQYDGFNISYDRLAILGGEIDPWRPTTPLADSQMPFNPANRPNNTEQPLILISGGAHHWDENGVFPNETTPDLPPAPVAQAQAAEASFVGAWLKEAEPVFGRTFVNSTTA